MSPSPSSRSFAGDQPQVVGDAPGDQGTVEAVGAGEMVIAIDTREQRPWTFPVSQRVTLASGDYSIVGFEHRIAIERKSKPDAYSSLGRGRERFEREWARLGELDYAAVVIEASLINFLQPPPRCQLHPRAAVGTLASWSVRYGVHVVFADDRRHAAAWALKVLTKFWEQHRAEVRAGEAA